MSKISARPIIGLFSSIGVYLALILFVPVYEVRAWCTTSVEWYSSTDTSKACHNVPYSSLSQPASRGRECEGPTNVHRGCDSSDPVILKGYCCHDWACFCDCQNTREGCEPTPPPPTCTTTAPATVSLSLPVNGAILTNQPQVTLTWNAAATWGENCSGNTIKKYKVQVNSGSGFVDVCNVNSPTTSCIFNADTTTNKTYRWRVIADNGAETSTSAEWSFTDNVGMNLTVTVQEISPNVSACPGTASAVMPEVPVHITVRSGTQDYTYSGKTGTDGTYTTFVRYSTETPPKMTICASYSGDMCQAYSLKCPEAASGCTGITQNVGSITQSVTLQLSKVIKDSWVAVADGDAAAGEFASVGPCLSEDVEGSFYGGMMNLYQLNSPANLYAISVKDSSILTHETDIAEGTGGGFVKNVGAPDPAMEKFVLEAPTGAKNITTTIPTRISPGIYRTTASKFNAQFSTTSLTYSFAYPGCSYVYEPPTSTEICMPGHKCYDTRFENNCSVPCLIDTLICPSGSYNTGNYTPRVALIYIDGNPADTLTINYPIKKSTAGYQGGHLIFLTKAKVYIPPTLGYTGGIESFSIDTDSQIDALIISSSGIQVSKDSDTTPMNPIVFQGLLANLKMGDPAEPSGKGTTLIRDLGIDNNLYPGVLVRYPLTLLRDINEYIRYENRMGRETGLETFDIQYEFEKVQEKVN